MGNKTVKVYILFDDDGFVAVTGNRKDLEEEIKFYLARYPSKESSWYTENWKFSSDNIDDGVYVQAEFKSGGWQTDVAFVNMYEINT